MSGEEFKNIINHFGEENIISIGFDNSASTPKFTSESPFSLANAYIEKIECLQFVQFDRHGNPFHVVKHIENIQSIIVKDGGIDIDSYDAFSIRG